MKFAKSKEFRSGFIAGFSSPFVFANGQRISDYSSKKNLIERAWANVGRTIQKTLDAEGKRVDPSKNTRIPSK